MPLLNPKEITLTDRKGRERKYLIGEIPASYSKEIVLQYPTSALPKVGDATLHMEITFKMMSFVGVPRGDDKEPLLLTTRELCDNHIPDLRTWMRIEREIAMYNWDFFLPEDLSDFWGRLKNLLVLWSQETSMDSSPQLSNQEKPPFTNSAPVTA